jgi:glycosyltransferase involved in cell wall biosynthesis
MRIAYITSGAAGMFCGSCMHDNTLAAELQRQGHDAILIPTYTPVRTDEDNVSHGRVFFGGINVFLQQKFAFFRKTPGWLDRFLDFNWLLNFLSRFAGSTQASQLGDLTISMLQGELGNQAKEIDKLVDWLASDIKPDVVVLSNVLIGGMTRRLRDRLKVPVVATLQGDDVFLEMLPEDCRNQAIDLINEHSQDMQGFIATSRYYADFMSGYLRIPRGRIDVVYPGLNLKGHVPRTSRNDVPAIGYFARICPEKGLHNLVDAYIRLRRMRDAPRCMLRVSGWLGQAQKDYFAEQWAKLQAADLLTDVKYAESPDLASKLSFLQSLDVLSVPTTYHEPKGLYILEAWANGIPVVQPAHGTFPELIEASGGGLLVAPSDPAALADTLRHLLNHPEEGRRLGENGRRAVEDRFTAAEMARATLRVLERHVSQ